MLPAIWGCTTDVFRSLLEGGKHALHQAITEAEQEEHRQHLRQQQRLDKKEIKYCFQQVFFFFEKLESAIFPRAWVKVKDTCILHRQSNVKV